MTRVENLDGRIRRLASEFYLLNTSPHFRFSEDSLMAIPMDPGIYVVSERGKPIYVGSSKRLRRTLWDGLFRGGNHYLATKLKEVLRGDREKVKEYLATHCSLQYSITNTEGEARWLQHFFIAVLEAPYNEWKLTQSKIRTSILMEFSR